MKSSLDDKRKQLEEYHEIHNDIEAHEKLVSMVFEKTSKLMTQTNDFSLSSYLTSIQSLFETIKIKSSKLIQQMGECIQDQEDYEERLINFTDFLTQQAHYLKEILSVKSQDPGFDVKSSLTVLIQRIDEGRVLSVVEFQIEGSKGFFSVCGIEQLLYTPVLRFPLFFLASLHAKTGRVSKLIDDKVTLHHKPRKCHL